MLSAVVSLMNAVLVAAGNSSQNGQINLCNVPCTGCFLNRKFALKLPVTFYHPLPHYIAVRNLTWDNRLNARFSF